MTLLLAAIQPENIELAALCPPDLTQKQAPCRARFTPNPRPTLCRSNWDLIAAPLTPFIPRTALSLSAEGGRDTPAEQLEKERAGLVLSPIHQKVSRLFYPLLFSVRRANSTTLATVHNVPARARGRDGRRGVDNQVDKDAVVASLFVGGTLLSLSRAGSILGVGRFTGAFSILGP